MLKAVIVGCGFMGRMHATVYGALEQAQLVGVVDRKPDRAERMGESFEVPAFATMKEAVAATHPDIVDICLPTDLHCEATIEAARLGKHVFCEKPMALGLDEAERMIAATEAAGVRFMIGHCIRFWPEYALLKHYVDTGEMGRLLSLNLTRYGEFPSWSTDNWLADEARAGGGALDMHIHDSDFALFLLGEPRTSASWGTQDWRGVSQMFTTMDYGGTVVHTEGGWNLPPATPFKMAFRAIFERGAAIMDGGPMMVYREGGEPEQPEFVKMAAQGGGNISDLGGYYHELDYFTRCVAEGEANDLCTPQSALASLRFTLDEIEQVKLKNAGLVR